MAFVTLFIKISSRYFEVRERDTGTLRGACVFFTVACNANPFYKKMHLVITLHGILLSVDMSSVHRLQGFKTVT